MMRYKMDKEEFMEKLKVLADKNGLTLYELVEMYVKPAREVLKQQFSTYGNIPLEILFIKTKGKLTRMKWEYERASKYSMPPSSSQILKEKCPRCSKNLVNLGYIQIEDAIVIVCHTQLGGCGFKVLIYEPEPMLY